MERLPFLETDYRDIKVEFGLKKKDRQRHFYLLGKTEQESQRYLKTCLFQMF